MTDRKEAIAILQAKAETMIEFFEAQDFPPTTHRIKLRPASYIIDPEKFIMRQTEVMRANWDDPFSRVFVCCYKNLAEFRKHLEAK